jgi:peroxiredoxin (alkyl hydroperoxide reductase subunit C)
MADPKDECVTPAGGPLEEAPAQAAAAPARPAGGEPVRARVGKPAPDFEASALVDGGFKNLKLSDYRGQWVVLCFYPGDFTFV